LRHTDRARTAVTIRLLAVVTALSLGWLPPPSYAAENAEPLASFSPRGTVKNVRQATARFVSPMVALGDPRLADPFDVDCPAQGHGRWADERDWVYDFTDDLPAGVRCKFTLRADLRALDDAPVAASHGYEFDTGGPTIRTSLPYQGSEIDEDQVFLLALDGEATTESIERAAYCAIDGIGERVPVRVLAGDERATVLAQRNDLGYSYYEILWKDGAGSVARVRDRTLERAEALVVALACKRRLPPDAKVQLVWGAGVSAPSGIATTIDQKLPFEVRAEFTAHVECDRVNARAGCLPLAPIRVRFSASVPTASASLIRLVAPDGKKLSPTQLADVQTVDGIEFPPPFGDGRTFRVEIPAGLADDIGRTLTNAQRFPLEIAVDDYPPLAKFNGEFGILESNGHAVLPVTLRNVELRIPGRRAQLIGRRLRETSDSVDVAEWLRRVERANQPRGEWSYDDVQKKKVWTERTADASVFESNDTTQPFDVPLAMTTADTDTTAERERKTRPFGVVGIPLPERGFYVVEIESRRLGEALLGSDRPRFVSTAVLVTNLSVHLKLGRESSRVWVTRLDDATPVANADIEIMNYCNGTLRWHGRTDADGIAVVDESFGSPHGGDYCGASYGDFQPLMVSARTDDDFSFALSSWTNGIGPYEFQLPVGVYSVPLYHTVLDRPLYRAGETVSMKHLLRMHTLGGVAVANDMPGPRRVRIAHTYSETRFELPVAAFDANGIAESTWAIPSDAKLGDYQIEVADGDKYGDAQSWRTTGRFRVEQFRLPTIRATIDGPADAQLRPGAVPLDLHAAYLSGGSASNLPVKLRTTVEPRTVHYADYDDYQFGGRDVTEGTTHTGSPAYDFDEEAPPSEVTARLLPTTLDGAGSARVSVADLPAIDEPSTLVAELDYADANGEILTSVNRVPLWPAAVTLGIRRDGWVASPREMRFRVVALDLRGRPIDGQRIDVTLYSASDYSYRKRLIGGFYAYENLRNVRRLEQACSGRTDAHGLLACEVAPGVSGEVIAVARATDADGHATHASTSVWVTGDDAWWFGGTVGERMDVLPEKKEYEAGDVARFQVRMPFRSATALVTVEREGVISSFVTTLSGREPVVEVPIDASYSPNVFVSVFVVRGRVGAFFSWLADIARRFDLPGFIPRDGGRPTGLVDLSKPSFRLGVAEIRVGWKPHRLDVAVSTDKPTFAVRDTARVKIHVARADGGTLPADADVALAAVDEALLDLAPNPSWDLLDAMMQRRGIEVWTATAQKEVIGRRSLETKRAKPGSGGGGRERARELFDTLLVWHGRVPLDNNGDAEVAVPLNDSLTTFRIGAIANAGPDLFGTGSATIATRQDLVLLSGLPPLVREGDRYAATFTVRNTTSRSIAVELSAATTPPIDLPPQRFDLAAGAAKDVAWNVTAPVGVETIVWNVAASGGTMRDRTKVTQRVIAAVPVRTFQATLAQIDAPFALSVERPVDAIPGRGGVDVTLQARLGDGLAGVRDFMTRYPYVCLEQQLSRAVALRSAADWNAWMDHIPTYIDRNGLLKYFATDALDGDDTLTAYALAIGNEAGYEIPDDVRTRLIKGLTDFVEGRTKLGSALPTADLTVRKLAAIEALSRYGAAAPKHLDSITIDPNLWPTSAVLDWMNVLTRVPSIPNARARAAEAEAILRARVNFQGTTMGFSTERTDALWWLMIDADSNAARIVLAALSRPAWHADAPRLVRGALGRQHFGRWNTTVANAWGTLALEKFSNAFEATPVAGTTRVTYGPFERSLAWPSEATPSTAAAASPSPQSAELIADAPWQANRGSFEIVHTGTGRPWALIRATAALPLTAPLSTGFTIARAVTAVERHDPARWTRGDIVRVHVDIDAQADMTWVVVDDPIPAGATILGSGLGGQSRTSTGTERNAGWAWLAFEQRAFEGFRAYYRFVPKGRFSVEYTVRLNNPGTFQLPPTRAEAMYAPEMLGELPNAPIVVEGAP
jgi:uncharacterized protein YfaS (alpha-2-macroglobulin family)